jgi:4-oxalocrotonate tautomerase
MHPRPGSPARPRFAESIAAIERIEFSWFAAGVTFTRNGFLLEEGTAMPVTRIAIRKGKSTEFKQALLDEIHEAIRETVKIQAGDRFMALTEHGEGEFAYGDFLGVDRSHDLVQIQIFWAPKPVDLKLAMYRKIVERLGKSPGVRPEDVLISVIESPGENWSFGNGEAQFHQPS